MADYLDSARREDLDKLVRLVRDAEIPDFKSWSTAAFAPDKAKTWADAYSAGLERNEAELEKLFAQLAQLKGQISAREINSQAADGETESSLIASFKQPIAIYVAEWRDSSASADAKGEPIGYFFFLDGKFRWNSALTLPKPRSTSNAVAPPRLVKRIDPIYPLEAQADGIEGVVVLRIRVQVDGSPIIEAVVSGDERLVESAKDAVRQWRFEPANVNDKPIEVETRVEVYFRLLRSPAR
jgi:TonB family protein